MEDNRPIQSKGFYDLSFRDWENEWERLIEEGVYSEEEEDPENQ